MVCAWRYRGVQAKMDLPMSSPRPAHLAPYRPPTGRRRALFILLAFTLGSTLAAGAAAWIDRAGNWYFHHAQEQAEQQALHKQTRVLVLGDSFLDAWPMRHHLAQDLKSYGRQHDLGMVVRGFRGWGPFDYRAASGQVLGGDLKPHLLVVFFFVGNDISDSIRAIPTPLPPHLKLPEPGQSARPLEPPPPPSRPPVIPYGLPLLPLLGCSSEMGEWAGTHEAFDWGGMKGRGIDPELIRMARSFLDDPRLGDDVVSPSLLTVAVHNPGIYDQSVLLRGPKMQRAWLMARAQLRWMFDGVRLNDADVALVIIPAVVQVTRGHDDFLERAGFVIREEMYSSNRPQRLLREFGKAEQISVLDLLPLLRRHRAPNTLYFKHDTHFNEQGNQVVFGLVKKHLLDPWLKGRKAALADE